MTLTAEGLRPVTSTDPTQPHTPPAAAAEPLPSIWLWPHPGTVDSAVELARLGVRALAHGCRLALDYFRAAVRAGAEQGAAGWRARWTEGVRAARLAVTNSLTALRGSPQLATGRSASVRLAEQAARLAFSLGPIIRPRGGASAGRILGGLLLANALVWSGLVGGVGWTIVAGMFAQPELGPGMRTLAAAIPVRFSSAAVFDRMVPRPSAAPARPAAWLPKAAALPWAPTATAIPIAYRVWEPSLPDEGGWSGSGGCSGSFVAEAGAGGFIWPTDDHSLAGRDFSARWHPGLDLTAPLGAPIYAAGSGVVVYAGWNVWGYGNVVIIDHGNSWHTLYAHLSQVDVVCGQAVAQGGVIGLAGSTGRSTGPHLHFEMRSAAGRVNPWGYLP